MKTKTKYPAAKINDMIGKDHIIVQVNGMEIGIYEVNGSHYAWRNICPHAGAPVCAGTVCGTRLPSMVYQYIHGKDQEILRCPWHGWEFDLITGQHLVDESVKLKGYEVSVEADQIYLLL